jgi:hypothetical protein
VVAAYWDDHAFMFMFYKDNYYSQMAVVINKFDFLPFAKPWFYWKAHAMF